LGGSTVTARAVGFGSFEQVKIYWTPTKSLLGTVTANVYGTVTGGAALSFTVPSGAPSGANKLQAVGQTTNATAQATFTVQ